MINKIKIGEYTFSTQHISFISFQSSFTSSLLPPPCSMRPACFLLFIVDWLTGSHLSAGELGCDGLLLVKAFFVVFLGLLKQLAAVVVV